MAVAPFSVCLRWHLPQSIVPFNVTSAAFSSARALTQKTRAKTANVAQSFLIVEPPLVTEPVRLLSDPVSDVGTHELQREVYARRGRNARERFAGAPSVPGCAWGRTVLEAPPPLPLCARRSLAGSAAPSGAQDREERGRGCMNRFW